MALQPHRGLNDWPEVNRRRIRRDLAARDALRDWKREAKRQLLTPADAFRMAPPLAKHGLMLEIHERRQQEKARRDQIRSAADRVQERALRRRGSDERHGPHPPDPPHQSADRGAATA